MNYYNNIKNILIENEINKKVKNYSINKVELESYYNVGKILSEAGKHYGEGIIKKYSIKLTSELGKGYSVTTLKYMRKFYMFYEKSQQPVDLLPWGHYTVLLSIKDRDKIKYYIDQCIKFNLSRNDLRQRIKLGDYERLPEEAKEKLKENKELTIMDEIKNPIVIKNSNNHEVISEKILQRLILQEIPSFLKELGSGFTFIDSEYKIKIGNTYNYIDLLLFNIELNCYVVVELKVTPLKKEHIGQIGVYINYVDRNLRRINQDKTIGLIICKKNNKYIIEYSSDKRIISKEYMLEV